MKTLVFFFFVLGTPVAALTGNQYIERCSGFPALNMQDAAYCVSYVSGALDGALAGAHLTRLSASVEAVQNGGYINLIGDPWMDLGICLSNEVTTIQLTAIFIQYLEDNPRGWHLPAAQSLLGVVGETFPCPQ